MQFAEGRMKKKVMGAVEAIGEGVGKVIFADGRVAEPISRALAGGGTHIGERSQAAVRSVARQSQWLRATTANA